jgi:thioredoxin-like negative regulator of GroEL
MTPATESSTSGNRAAGTVCRVTQGKGRRWLTIAALTTIVIVAGAVSIFRSVGADPDRLWEQGQAAYEARRLDHADAILVQLEKLRPASVKDWILRAEVAMARGRSAAALDALAQVPDSEAAASQARFQAGKLEFERAHAHDAETQWKRALALDPNRIDARRSLAHLYALQLRTADFDAQFRAIARLQPISFAHAFFWSQVNCSIYDPAEAAAELERFLKADPDNRPSRLALYEVYLKLQRAADAERLLVELPPDDPDALAGQARVALIKGDEPAASALLAQGPADHAGLAKLRGRQALLHHDAASAVRHYRIAHDADPQDHDALQGLARAYRMAGDEAAAKLFQERVRVQEQLWELVQRASKGNTAGDLKLLRSLGAACEAANRPEEARAWFSLVIARDPLDAVAQQTLYRLTEASK